MDEAIAEALVIPLVVVVRDELADGTTQQALTDEHHPLEARFLDGADEAFRVGIQVRGASGEADGGDTRRGERVSHGRTEEWVAVVDEEPHVPEESVVGIGGVPHELGNPGPVGLGVDAGDLNAAGGPVQSRRGP